MRRLRIHIRRHRSIVLHAIRDASRLRARPQLGKRLPADGDRSAYRGVAGAPPRPWAANGPNVQCFIGGAFTGAAWFNNCRRSKLQQTTAATGRQLLPWFPAILPHECALHWRLRQASPAPPGSFNHNPNATAMLWPPPRPRRRWESGVAQISRRPLVYCKNFSSSQACHGPFDTGCEKPVKLMHALWLNVFVVWTYQYMLHLTVLLVWSLRCKLANPVWAMKWFDEQ